MSLQPTCAQPTDRRIANSIFENAFEHKLIEKSMGEVMVHIGRQFIGSPYAAGTLDRADTEQLVCNLQTFDCVTFIENVLALARCVKQNTLSFDAYQGELRHIRYRGGTMNGYGSRLHYFTDWISDNEKKLVVKDMTKTLGGIPYRKTVNFMTLHRSSYPKLSNDSLEAVIKQMEAHINRDEFFYIPKSRLKNLEGRIAPGDIIAITTSSQGLDVSHTGIAVRMEDRSLHYMHAPDIGDSVRISVEPLLGYLQKHPNQTGIIVARPSEPKR